MARRKESSFRRIDAVDFASDEEENARTRGQTDVVRLLTSLVLSLVPERYRSRLRWGAISTAGAITSGVVQMLACFGLMIYGYFSFFEAQMRAIPTHVMVAATEQGGDTAVRGMGLVILVAYLLQPVSLLLIYFLFEGLVRLSAALITAEVVPTLPLELVALAHRRIARAKYELDLGPPVEDLVSRGAGEFALCIATCRPKPWTQMTTISFEDKLYELAREDTAEPPRMWVYVLRGRPESKIIRGEIYEYSPDEVMVMPQAKLDHETSHPPPKPGGRVDQPQSN